MLLLDGGVATELQRRGVRIRAPWWTTRAIVDESSRKVLLSVHESYLGAGAQLITANTFRCTARTLASCGLDRAAAVATVRAAVETAKAAARSGPGKPALVAGSLAPVADCYRPDLVPPDDELRAEHGWLAGRLVREGVDLVLVETMNTAREARAALAQALGAGGRAWVSFACTSKARLLSGEPLAAAARAVEDDGASAVLVNCTTAADTTTALSVLRESCEGPVGAYPNVEDRAGVPPGTHVDRHLPAALDPAELADVVRGWREQFAPDIIIGGCCGTTPAHIAELARHFRDHDLGR